VETRSAQSTSKHCSSPRLEWSLTSYRSELLRATLEERSNTPPTRWLLEIQMKCPCGSSALCVTLCEAKDEYQGVADGHHADHRMAERLEEPGVVD
jgi:hypothetical protein